MLNFLQNIAQNYELDSIDYISKVDAYLLYIKLKDLSIQ
jgi:hypothetical protein